MIFDVFRPRITKENITMALDQSVLSELLDALRAGGDMDFMREAMQLVLQALIDLEAEQHIGAARYERSETRTTQRNGTRARLLSTKAGDVELAIPKLRHGSFYPSLLEPRRRIDRALWAVIMEAFVHGVSTRKVDDLVAALGIDAGVSKSHVSRICAELDVAVGEFRERRLDHVEFPYLFSDATYVKAHQGAHVVSKAIVVATGVTTDGMREVLGLAVGDSEDTAFWTSFLRSLRARGLGGVQLVISDAHQGLRAAIDKVILGAAWQRCRVHFLRNVLAQRRRRAQRRWSPPPSARSSPSPTPPPSPNSCTRSPTSSAASSPTSPPCSATTEADLLRLRRLPPGPLAQDLVNEPSRAGQQGDQTTHQRRGHLPQRRRRRPPRRRRPARGPRRMADRRPPLPLRSLDGAHRPQTRR